MRGFTWGYSHFQAKVSLRETLAWKPLWGWGLFELSPGLSLRLKRYQRGLPVYFYGKLSLFRIL